MAYGDIKDLNRKTAADKLLCDEAFKTPKHDGYQCGLASVVHKFFDKKTSSGIVKNEIMSYNELAEKLPKPIIRKCFEKNY